MKKKINSVALLLPALSMPVMADTITLDDIINESGIKLSLESLGVLDDLSVMGEKAPLNDSLKKPEPHLTSVSSDVTNQREASASGAPKIDVADVAQHPHVGGLDLYLKNIPAPSFLNVGKDIFILPKEESVYFNDGVRVYTNPLHGGDLLETYCKVNMVPNDAARKLKSGRDGDERIVIEKVSSKNIDQTFSDVGFVNIQIVKFDVSNPHIGSVICYSGKMDSPMSLKDLSFEVGEYLSVEYSGYMDI